MKLPKFLTPINPKFGTMPYKYIFLDTENYTYYCEMYTLHKKLYLSEEVRIDFKQKKNFVIPMTAFNRIQYQPYSPINISTTASPYYNYYGTSITYTTSNTSSTYTVPIP